MLKRLYTDAMWQDWIIAACQWVFVIALIPAIRHATDKPPLSSSLLTALLLTVMSATFATLHLWNSTLSALAVAIAWYILAWQKWRLGKPK